jgi:hypothetical protein
MAASLYTTADASARSAPQRKLSEAKSSITFRAIEFPGVNQSAM